MLTSMAATWWRRTLSLLPIGLLVLVDSVLAADDYEDPRNKEDNQDDKWFHFMTVCILMTS